MYHHLSGRVSFRQAGILVLEVGGVGYLLHMAQAEHLLPDVDQNCTIFTHQVVRENEIFLCGFLKQEERALFLNLIKVSGVGPSMALQILGQTVIQTVVSDIVGGNVTALTKIKGVGKKTAERIVLELRDKLKVEAFAGLLVSAGSKDVWPEDALLALIALGLSSDRARERLEAISKGSAPPSHVDEWIRQALKYGV